MTDFLEKSILLEGLSGTCERVKDNETSAASAIVKSALNISTTGDSYYTKPQISARTTLRY